MNEKEKKIYNEISNDVKKWFTEGARLIFSPNLDHFNKDKFIASLETINDMVQG